METAGWIRLGLVALAAIVVIALLFRPKVFQRRQLGDARENEHAMSGHRPHEQDSHGGGGHSGGQGGD